MTRRSAVLLAVTAATVMITSLTFLLVSPDRGLDESALAECEARVYKRILAETWHELAPVYRDFEIDVRDPPNTIGELLRPLVKLNEDLSKDPVEPYKKQG